MKFPWQAETKQFFADLKQQPDAPTDFEAALRSWLWFSCNAARRTEIEAEIRLRQRLLDESHDASIEALPIEQINGRDYAIEGRRRTPDGYERIDAIDLTGMDEIEYVSIRPLRMAGFAFIAYPDEGYSSMICPHGIRWVSGYAVALSRSPKLHEQIMDELEASVDAGGGLPS